MATIPGKLYVDPDRVARAVWETLTETNNDGAPVRMAQYPDRTVSVTGTFGSGSVTIQGSNDGTNWFTLSDHAGAPIAFSDQGMALIAECPLFIRPLAANGTSMDIDVIIVGCPRF